MMNTITPGQTSIAQPILAALGRLNPAQQQAERDKREQFDTPELRGALESRLEDPERWDGMA
ncbi:MAG TPA: hypothetical protein VGN72_22430 [Tepidisphaeraceae bacterium]|jgi:hypothetical protein|nr:hypothetical protein [Tepidisphaeraceae bacterium]